MASVFISYRRADSPGTTGRLYDFLKQRLYPVPVFRDIYDLMPGVYYEDAIRRALESSGVVLAVIGPEWLNASDARGRRLDDPRDLLRMEIATALAWKIPVIPVLVDSATMPALNDLPPDLQQLRGLQSIKLSDDHWDHDAERLLKAVAAMLNIRLGPADRAPGSAVQTPDRTVTRRRGFAAGVTGLILFLMALAVGAAILVRVLLPTIQESDLWETFRENFQGTNPSIVLSKSSGPPGTILTIDGSGFRSGETVVIWLSTEEVGRVEADDDGAFADKEVQVPANWPFRNTQFHFRAEGESSVGGADMPFQVT